MILFAVVLLFLVNCMYCNTSNQSRTNTKQGASDGKIEPIPITVYEKGIGLHSGPFPTIGYDHEQRILIVPKGCTIQFNFLIEGYLNSKYINKNTKFIWKASRSAIIRIKGVDWKVQVE